MSVQSSELGPPTPSPASGCDSPSPQAPRGGEAKLACGEGGGGPNTDPWTDTLVLYIIIPLRWRGSEVLGSVGGWGGGGEGLVIQYSKSDRVLALQIRRFYSLSVTRLIWIFS